MKQNRSCIFLYFFPFIFNRTLHASILRYWHILTSIMPLLMPQNFNISGIVWHAWCLLFISLCLHTSHSFALVRIIAICNRFISAFSSLFCKNNVYLSNYACIYINLIIIKIWHENMTVFGTIVVLEKAEKSTSSNCSEILYSWRAEPARGLKIV